MREGLDIPEVSLVAVLDADKEGFLLRLNETSGPVPDTNSGLMPSKSGFLSAIAGVKTGLLDYHKSLFYVSY